MDDEKHHAETWWPPWHWNWVQWIWVSGLSIWLSFLGWVLTPGVIEWLGSLE
jgi:hypothetical protein